jgi:hypothetical protein
VLDSGTHQYGSVTTYGYALSPIAIDLKMGCWYLKYLSEGIFRPARQGILYNPHSVRVEGGDRFVYLVTEIAENPC